MGILAKYILRNIARRPLSIFMMAGSMVLVSFVIAAVAGVANGMYKSVHSVGSADRVLVRNLGSINDLSSSINNDLLNQLVANPLVKRHSAESINVVSTHLDDVIEFMRFRGVEPEAYEFHNIQMVEGRMPESGKLEFIIGETAHRRYPHIQIGKKHRMNQIEFECVGIFRGPAFYDNEIWTARQSTILDGQGRDPNIVTLETNSPADASALMEELKTKKALKADPAIELEYFGRMSGGLRDLYICLAIVLVLVVAGAATAASCLLAVLLRLRVTQLSVLRAIGFRSWRVSLLMFIEAEVLTMIGACIGAFGAMYALRNVVAHSGMATEATNFEAAVTPQALVGVLVLMAVIGGFSSLIPIIRLKRLEIRDALSAG